MFLFLAIGCLVLFTGISIYTAGCYVQNFKKRDIDTLTESENNLFQVKNQRDKIIKEKKDLEHQAIEIFTLYEMTREITQQPRQEEAFEVFRQKIEKTIAAKECQFYSSEQKLPDNLKDESKNFIFPLKEKRRKLGTLIFPDLSRANREKAMILGHQFALALRRVRLYQEIEELAITDSLTGCHTRRYFMERFEEEFKRTISRKTSVSFLMIDVDRFKFFNDKYGHLAGDHILKIVGGIIKDNVREIDIVGRYGGEEFCVVLPDTEQQGAQFAAERIRKALQETEIKAYDAIVRLTISIGIAIFPQSGTKISELIDKADWALYRAKKKGRNCTCIFGVYE